jgi:hypothetical protein
MKRMLGIFGIMGLAVFSAAAQESAQLDSKLTEEIKAKAELLAITAAREGAVMAQPVLGAPFSGTEANETDQTLGDGTKIHRENHTQVYRDGAGRSRRDTGNTSVIMDPVAKVRYSIDHEHKRVVAMPMNMVGKVVPAGANNGWAVTTRFETGNTVILKNGSEQVFKFKASEGANSEDLGPQTMEGVVAQGTRTTRTIPAGDIGNDRPINITSERWYSPQLQTIMMTRQNDPRTGETVFRLTNVKLGEPDASLFQVPAGYQVTDRK